MESLPRSGKMAGERYFAFWLLLFPFCFSSCLCAFVVNVLGIPAMSQRSRYNKTMDERIRLTAMVKAAG